MEKDPSTPCAKLPITQFCPLSEAPFMNWRNQLWELCRFFAVAQPALAHPGSQRGYLVTVLDELLPADVGHDPSGQCIPQHIDHCSKPVSGK